MSTTITLALNAERSLFMLKWSILTTKNVACKHVYQLHTVLKKLYDDTVPDTMTLTIVVWHESSAQSSTKP